MTSQLRVDRISPATGSEIIIDGLNDAKNLIINGAMQVAQRGTQVTGVTTAGYKTCDRWGLPITNLGTWTVDQSTDAPNGFSNSLKMTCTTANASPASGDYYILNQRIEAKNLQHLAYGTADAKSMTISFWVKSNKTGPASFCATQNDNSNKMISKSYTINSANTWEYKTISIPSDTAGVINNDNGAGLFIEWWLNGGSDFTIGSHATTWIAIDHTRRNASNLGVGGTVGDYFAITGVQLEVGEVATPFEHESFGSTLQKCQRYYQLGGAGAAGSVDGSSGRVFFSSNLPVQMRVAPSVSLVSGAIIKVRYGPTDQSATSPTINFSSPGHSSFACGISGFSTSMPNYTSTHSRNDTLWLQLDAEL